MTLPALIAKYQKVVMTNLLKQTYAQINTGISLVATRDFDGQNMGKWQCSEYATNGRIFACFHRVFDTMNGAKNYPPPTDAKQAMCYEGEPYPDYKYIDTGRSFSTVSRSARMPNGACVLYHGGTWAGDARGALFIDVNGPYKGPNEYGKDLFLFLYIVANTETGIVGNGYNIYPYPLANWDGQIRAISRNQLKNSYCYKRSNTAYNFRGCAALIMLDGWTMKGDYPW